MSTEFEQFYKEVKRVERKDASLTSSAQIERLLRPGSIYSNLNPYGVLDIDPDASVDEMKKKFRKLSLLLHPDKNRDDSERAQKAFDYLSKSWKLLEDEGSRENCYQVVMQAKNKVYDYIKVRKRQLANEGKSLQVEEETDSEKFNHAVSLYTTKIFADLELKRKNLANREMDERKRQRDINDEEKETLNAEAEWKKKFEDTRDTRVGSWQKFRKRLKDLNDLSEEEDDDDQPKKPKTTSQPWTSDINISKTQIPKVVDTSASLPSPNHLDSNIYKHIPAPPISLPNIIPMPSVFSSTSATSSADLQIGNCYNVFADNVCHPDNKKKKKYIKTFRPPKHKMETR